MPPPRVTWTPFTPRRSRWSCAAPDCAPWRSPRPSSSRRLGRALRALNPTAVVLTGRRVSLDSIGRLVYAVRSIVREVIVFDYRSAVPDTGASTVFRLGDNPVAARDALLSRLEQATAQNAPRPVPAVVRRSSAPAGA